MFFIAPGVTSVIAGLTITGGNAAGSELNSAGGSILSYDAMLTVSNCVVSAEPNKEALYNYVTTEVGTLTVVNSRISNSGFGIVSRGPGWPVLVVQDCIVVNNGKGISSTGPQASLLVERCTVNSNRAGVLLWSSAGGGLVVGGRQSTIRSSTIHGNAAQLGGGIYNYSEVVDAELRIEDCTISGNLAQDAGGGLYVIADASLGIARVSVENTTFSGNSALDRGGAIENYAFFNTSEVRLRHCTFHGNAAPSGGGIHDLVEIDGEAVTGLSHTLMSRGPTGGNYASEGGLIEDLGFNLSDDSTTTGFAAYAADLRLAPLADNGVQR